METLADPQVSRVKFSREIDKFRALETQHGQRGCWLVKADFPEAFVVFGNSKTTPTTVVFGAVFNFDDYDILPPSVKIVNPFTKKPLTLREFPAPPLLRQAPPVPVEGAPEGEGHPGATEQLLQSYGADDIPFLCMQGVREYHSHPAHSGDPWLLHRTTGKGTLNHIVEQLYRYGVEPLVGLHVNLTVGFAYGGVPT